jgi:DNA-binding response OmpR family regulator
VRFTHPANPPKGVETVSASPRVLIVDDDPDSVFMMTRVFSRWGWEPVEASAVDEALALLAEPFDLILLDLMLPRISGVELLRAVRARGLSVPVALMSGNPTEATAREVEGLNPDRVFMKSFAVDELKDYARALHDRFHSARSGRESP